jgi:hypothetical protein
VIQVHGIRRSKALPGRIAWASRPANPKAARRRSACWRLTSHEALCFVPPVITTFVGAVTLMRVSRAALRAFELALRGLPYPIPRVLQRDCRAASAARSSSVTHTYLVAGNRLCRGRYRRISVATELSAGCARRIGSQGHLQPSGFLRLVNATRPGRTYCTERRLPDNSLGQSRASQSSCCISSLKRNQHARVGPKFLACAVPRRGPFNYDPLISPVCGGGVPILTLVNFLSTVLRKIRWTQVSG